MKKLSLFFTIFATVTVLFYGFGTGDPDIRKTPVSKPELMVRFYEDLHRPYGAVLPMDVQDRILKDVNNVPNEIISGPNAVNSWQLKGPVGMNQASHPGSYYSGRILDIEVENGATTRVAAASGGLWGFVLIFPVPLSDKLNSLAVSTFDSKPGDANTVFVGTGEYGVRSGTGLWKTTDGGTSWTNVTLTPTPDGFFRLRYDPVNTNIIHLATTAGYYKSTNGGTSFTRYLSGYTTDIAVNPNNNQEMYTSIWTDGVYKSTNGGVNWTKLTSGGIPTTNVGRVSISIAPSATSTVYFNIARSDNSNTLGIYKTTNSGSTFTNVHSTDFMWGQGWYNNSIGVCPTNSNIVIAGGGTLIRTSNGGTAWNDYLNNTDPLYDPYNIHADQHSVTWNAAGTGVWTGSDGGMAYSADGGLTWSTTINLFPITQYVNIDVGGNGTHYAGGSQDNSISGTTNGGTNWWFWIGGDGGGVAIDPSTPSKFAVTNGVYGGSWAFRRLLTTNNGTNWNFIDNGIDASDQWYNKIRNDRTAPVYLFNNSGNYVYESTNYGSNWTKLNSTAFPVALYNMTVSKYATSTCVYACLNSTTAGQRLRVYDASAWYERSTGFPSGVMVQTVAQHPTNENTAYALMNGLGSTQKIFKTTNRGVNWTNVTGNLPNIPVTDLVPHPTDNNKLYLGTEFGCYRTTNGGTNWTRWNNGMPEANIISEMRFIDSTSTNGRFYVVAGTYGRGIWTREVSGDDPIGVWENGTEVKTYSLAQNYPNPFNPATQIQFSLPSAGFVSLKIFDVAGKEVQTLVNGKMGQGVHTVTFDGSTLSSGIYFYKLETEKFTDTKKMILLK